MIEGEHFALRIFFLFKFDILHVLPLLLAIAFSYALFPSRKIIIESYQILMYVMCCCGAMQDRLFIMRKKQHLQKEQELTQDLLDKPMTEQRNRTDVNKQL